MLKNFFLTALALWVFSVAYSQSYNQPESVEYDAANNRYLISNKGAGEILARSASGALSVFTSMPSSPHGLHIVGNTVYVCDGARVKGYDLTSAAEVMNVNLGATFLNGITGDGGDNLYVTDFTAKKIYRVSISSQAFNVFVTGLAKSPNGILYDGANSRLVFVSWGTSATINEALLADSTVNLLVTTSLSNIDGITRDCAGSYYVTAWGTQSLLRYNSAFSSAPVTVLTGLSSPADICYNAASDTIAIPNSGNSTVAFYYTNCNAVGMEESSSDAVEVFPVPANDVVNILLPEDWKSIEYSVFNAEGKLVKKVEAAERNIILSLDKFPAGIYYLVVTSGKDRVVKKLVKQ